MFTVGDSRVPRHAELLLRAQRAKQQEWHAPETNPPRITRAGGTVPIKMHGGVRSWVLIYKLGVAKMPNHAYYLMALLVRFILRAFL